MALRSINSERVLFLLNSSDRFRAVLELLTEV